MEKFSDFHDPLTGKNPFIPVKNRKENKTVKITSLLTIFRNLFVLFLIKLGFNSTIRQFIKIICYDKRTNRSKTTEDSIFSDDILKSNKIICNSVSLIDTLLLKLLFPEHQIVYTVTEYKEHPRVIFFIEECRSNGQMLLKFKEQVECDLGLIFRYNSDCVFTGGSKLKFWLNLCFKINKVEIEAYDITHSSQLAKKCDLIHSQFGLREKLKYAKALADSKRKNK
ncbi:hypothetical protein M153_2200050313 [Pseudoloma neurophilia]|uniref:Uncharacterized protein n=1 Tax=Pseudoloma neurophilia TaxID=146866 RepID=A0A0R0M0X5_9MICR|nr:hypothetical protein M153_2200050313 [Pseudoloma neurophilia]